MKKIIFYILMLIVSIANAQKVVRSNPFDPYSLIGYSSPTYWDYDLASNSDSAVNDLSLQIQELSLKIASLTTERAKLKTAKIETMLQKNEVMITYYHNMQKFNRVTITQNPSITTTVNILLNKKVIKTVEGYTSKQVISFEGKGEWLSIDIIGKDGKSLEIISENGDCVLDPRYTETYGRYDLASNLDSTVNDLLLQIQELSPKKSLLEKKKVDLKTEKIETMLQENEIIVKYIRKSGCREVYKVVVMQNPKAKTVVLTKYGEITVQTVVEYTSKQEILLPYTSTNAYVGVDVLGADGKSLNIIREYAVCEGLPLPNKKHNHEKINSFPNCAP